MYNDKTSIIRVVTSMSQFLKFYHIQYIKDDSVS